MRFVLLVLISVSLLITQSCKRECHDPANPDCENYNPCFGKEKTSADFTISEVVGGRAFETDEVWRLSYVQFTARQEFDSYQWVIGTHKDTFYTKTCGLSGFPEGATIKVRLVGKRQPQTGCFAGDDGIDTVYKTFKVTAHDSILPIFGEYEGYYDAYPDKKVTVRVWREMVPDMPTWSMNSESITNIPVQGGAMSIFTSLGSTAFFMDNEGVDSGPNGGYAMKGYVYLLPDRKTLKAEYTHWDTATRFPNYVRIKGGFTGTRK